VFKRAQTEAAHTCRSMLRRARCARTRLRLTLFAAAGVYLAFALPASAGVPSGLSAGRDHTEAAAATSPLSVGHVSVRTIGGRIVASATIMNTTDAPVRSTTGALGLISGLGSGPTGAGTFSVASLSSQSSRTVRTTTRPVRDLPVRPGTVQVVFCTDIYSQIRRFSPNANCSGGGTLAIPPGGPLQRSGRVPNTIVTAGPAGDSRSSTAVLRFASTVDLSHFECRLDGGPWLACDSPQRYAGLVDGRHVVAVRAVSASGRQDPTPAHAAWTVDTVAPKLTLRRPVDGSTTSDHRLAFSGTGGIAATDSSKVTVKVFSGSHTSGSPVRTLTSTLSHGKWSVTAARPLADGTYTAQAEQSDRVGNHGISAPSTFTIRTVPATPPAPPTTPAPPTPPAPPTTPGPPAPTPPAPPTAPAPSTFSVGGTVSGLSDGAVVVLQDNGGDNLNVASNGSFAFATPVVDGGAYEVTVASNPTGEACTVAGGSGKAASANVVSVVVTCVPSATQIGTDDFNRTDGGLGAGWAAMTDGPLSIASQRVVGTAGVQAGDIRTAESYGSDQYSQIEVTSNSIGPGVGGDGEWVGPTVRSQNGGADTYLGIYFWNQGSPELRLYVRTGGTFTLLGSYDSGVLPGGTQLTLTAVGSTISFATNGIARITAHDSTLTGGDPGIMTFDSAAADNWSGGNAAALPSQQPMQVQSEGTDSDGVASYDVISSDDGDGSQILRVLAPTDPAPGVPHNFLYVLPVEPKLGTSFGDGLEALRSLDAQNQYNLTIIEPSFAVDPWYADSPDDPNLQYETFMTKDLVPWVTKTFGTSGKEQNWLIGFSKSGLGAQDLLLKHPDLFAAAASWDFPADMDTYETDAGNPTGDGVNYGTDANFQSNYRLTQSFVDARKAPFQSENRIWIGGFANFETDVSDYGKLLSSEGVAHTTETPQAMAHRWDSGWVPIALSALSQDGAALPAAP
jgi:Bacterial Ig-like domain/Putative esterase